MRKGKIVAVPNMFYDADRISNNPSLEIMHKDGTIMIYENLDPNKLFVKAGSIVYPGQQLGIIDDISILEVYLYMIDTDNQIKRLNINYYVSKNKIEIFSDSFKKIRIENPNEIIIKEMSKREIKKTRKTK